MTSAHALGMHRPIARRDFMHGAAALALMGVSAPGFIKTAQAADSSYPPAKMGLRGSHPGSFELAHALRDGTLDITAAKDVDTTFDLVVVGGGLSGLSAAHFYIKHMGTDVRVLILENHDDFGGHAKRNEFMVDGKPLVVNGGTLEIESPYRYNKWATQVLTDIGVDIERYETANESNHNLYRSLGLGRAHFFDKETWGVDKLVKPSGNGGFRDLIAPETLKQTPLSDKAQADLARLITDTTTDYMPGLTSTQKKEILARTSYQEYLLNIVKVDKQVIWFVKTTGHANFCVGADATSALFAFTMSRPGFAGLKLDPVPNGLFEDLPGGQHGRQKEGGPYIHFPDGNATLARLLVRKLIPDAVAGETQEDMGMARVDYARLDRDGQTTRIRLNSTVVRVEHDGDPATATEARISYLQSGKLMRVRGRAVVMACWNMIIPHIMPELGTEQRDALMYGVKGPLVYTSVAVRNWRAFKELGISSVSAPTMYHEIVALTEAASLGKLEHARTPDEPVALHLVKTMTAPGLPRKDQHRVGRNELLETTFETFEYQIRDQLTRILSPGGFDAARDIAGITVNRWPHGYSYTYNSLDDPLEWVYTESNERPCVVGRQPFGLVTIANADASASPHTDAAFLEAHRAVGEVLQKKAYPFVMKKPANPV